MFCVVYLEFVDENFMLGLEGLLLPFQRINVKIYIIYKNPTMVIMSIKN